MIEVLCVGTDTLVAHKNSINIRVVAAQDILLIYIKALYRLQL